MERSEAPANIADEAARENHTGAATQIETGSANGSTGSGQGSSSAALLTIDQIKQRFERAASDLVRAKFDYIFKLKVLEFYFGITINL